MTIKLPDKDPQEVLDYKVDFGNLLPSGVYLDDASVSIESANNGESPIALAATSVQIVVNDASPQLLSRVLFWLRGGTEGVKYTGVVTASDNQGASPDRKYVRRFTVKVKKQ